MVDKLTIVSPIPSLGVYISVQYCMNIQRNRKAAFCSIYPFIFLEYQIVFQTNGNKKHKNLMDSQIK